MKKPYTDWVQKGKSSFDEINACCALTAMPKIANFNFQKPDHFALTKFT